MKIDPSIGKISGHSVGSGSPVATGKSSSETSSITSTKTSSSASLVQVSTEFRNLTQVNKSGSFNAEKVEAIKTAIAEGRFQIDAAKIADGLIATAQDLLGAKKESV